MRNSRASLYAAASLGAIGLLLIFGPLLRLLNPHPHAILRADHDVVHATSIISLPIMGILLLYLATFVYRRRLFAAYAASCLSILILAYLSVVYSHGSIIVLVTALTAIYIVIFVVKHKEFTVKNNLEELPQYLQQISIVAFIGFVYGVTGFYLLGQRFFHVHFSFLESIGLTINSLTGFSGSIAEPTHMGQLFIDSLGGIGIVLFILLLGVLFRPLSVKILPHREDEERNKAKEIIQTYSTSSEDFFKLWPHDKHYFFLPNRPAFLAYTQAGKTIIVLGDPVGDSTLFTELINRFTDYHYALGWSMAAINTTNEGKALFETRGFKSLFIGNEGIVDIQQFVEATSRDKHFRYVANKGHRDELQVEEWRDFSEDRLAKLQTISDSWLTRDGRREYTFFMGYFDRAYLQECRVFVLFQNDKPVGYVNLIPSFHAGHESLDQFRAGSDISSIGMHFLLLKVLETLHAEHAKTLNIGLSPLSGMGKDSIDLVPRATLQLMRLLGASYYSFKGLEQFKNKFKPNWEARSIVFSGAGPNLLRISRDIERASNYEPLGNRNLYVTTTIGVIVLTLGLYFILG